MTNFRIAAESGEAPADAQNLGGPGDQGPPSVAGSGVRAEREVPHPRAGICV